MVLVMGGRLCTLHWGWPVVNCTDIMRMYDTPVINCTHIMRMFATPVVNCTHMRMCAYYNVPRTVVMISKNKFLCEEY